MPSIVDLWHSQVHFNSYVLRELSEPQIAVHLLTKLQTRFLGLGLVFSLLCDLDQVSHSRNIYLTHRGVAESKEFNIY